MAGSRKSTEIDAQSRKPLPQGYVPGAGEDEHLVHFRNARNIFFKVDAARASNNFALGTQQLSVGSGIPANRSAHSCCTGFHDLSGNLHHGLSCWRWVSLTRMARAMWRRRTGPTNLDRRSSEVTKALPAYCGAFVRTPTPLQIRNILIRTFMTLSRWISPLPWPTARPSGVRSSF
jgi:hypothetical protein